MTLTYAREIKELMDLRDDLEKQKADFMNGERIHVSITSPTEIGNHYSFDKESTFYRSIIEPYDNTIQKIDDRITKIVAIPKSLKGDSL